MNNKSRKLASLLLLVENSGPIKRILPSRRPSHLTEQTDVLTYQANIVRLVVCVPGSQPSYGCKKQRFHNTAPPVARSGPSWIV